MPTQFKVLLTSYLELEIVDTIRKRVAEVEVIYRPDLLGQPRYIADHTSIPERNAQEESEWRELLAQADILFDFDLPNSEKLPELAPNVKWIQATSAGIGQFVRRMGYAEKTDWKYTTASGVHARPLAEFALMAMLMFAKDYEYLQSEKSARHWARYCGFELSGKTVGIVGLGKIGREVARLAKAFDMRVVGNRRNPQRETAYVDQCFGANEIDQFLGMVDFIVLATPHTDETVNLLTAERLALLKPTCVLINVARGAVVDERALLAQLQSGGLRGAALDVFAEEPLPQGSPLWDMPNVIISPHSASTADTENWKICDLFCDNLNRFLCGEPLINELDVELLY